MADLSSLQALMDAADDVGNTGLQDIAVASIEPDPNQPRTQFPEIGLRDLAASIQAQGVVQPLVVRPLDGERFVLIAGERRWRAARMAGLESVPVVVRDLEPQEAIAVQLVENLDREDLSIIDQALGVVRLLEETKAKAGEVAKMLGKSASWVSQRRKIGKRHDLASVFVDSGATNDPETLAMLIDLHRVDRAAYDRFLGPGSVQRSRVREALDSAKGKGRQEQQPDTGAAATNEEQRPEDPATDLQPTAASRHPLSSDPAVAATQEPIAEEGQGREDRDAPAPQEHPRSGKRRSSAQPQISDPADKGASVSSEKLREAEADLRRLLQLDVRVTSDEGSGAVVRIHCDSAVDLFALVERLV